TRIYDLKKLDAPSVIARHISSDINAVAMAPDGASIATVDGVGAISLWDVVTGKPLKSFSCPEYAFSSVEFSPDGKLIAVLGIIKQKEPNVELRDAATGQVIASMKGHNQYENCVAFSPDFKTLATDSDDGQIKLWDVSAAQERLSMQWRA